MAESYSSSLKITLIGDGDLAGTWGDTTNTNWNLVEQAITGVDTLSAMGDSNYTLSNLNGTSDEARNQTIIVPSSTFLSATRYVYAPLVAKSYVISNQSSGGQSIYIQGIVSGTPAGSPLLIPNGVTTYVYCDGSTGFYAGVTGSAGNFVVNGNFSATGSESVTGNLTVGGNLNVLGYSNVVPSGTIMMWATSSAPTGYLLCNGQSLSTSTYPNLFSAIGYTFGGSGSSFLVPNYQNQMPIGASGSYALASTGGSTSITTSNLPSHSHPFSASGTTGTGNANLQDPGHGHQLDLYVGSTGVGGGLGVADQQSYEAPSGRGQTAGAFTNIYDAGHAHSFSTSGTTNATGSNAPYLPPYLAINFIIKT